MTGEISIKRANWNEGQQFIRYKVQSNGYKHMQQHEKIHRNPKKRPVITEDYNIWNEENTEKNKSRSSTTKD